MSYQTCYLNDVQKDGTHPRNDDKHAGGDVDCEEVVGELSLEHHQDLQTRRCCSRDKRMSSKNVVSDSVSAKYDQFVRC